MDSKKLITVLKSGVVDPKTTALALTATTTGAQAASFTSLGVISGKTVTIDWGDGTIESFTTTASRAHAYAGAGTWAVKVGPRNAINRIDLYDTKFTVTIDATNPMPAGLTVLYMLNLHGLTWNVNATPMPSNLTYLRLLSLSGLTWNINTTPLPPSLDYFECDQNSNITWNVSAISLPNTLRTFKIGWNVPGIVWTGMLPNAIQSAACYNSLDTAKIDTILYTILANKANFTYSTPSLDLSHWSNAAPSGTYQAADPVTSGKEAKYALVNGNGSYAPGPEWTVTTN